MKGYNRHSDSKVDGTIEVEKEEIRRCFMGKKGWDTAEECRKKGLSPQTNGNVLKKETNQVWGGKVDQSAQKKPLRGRKMI